MSTEIYERTPWIPKSEEEKAEVRRQLHRLLETNHFKNSKRYPALLRFIVEETLEGRGEFLKERLLGVRVFDRPTDYDTASDPVVRVTIAEVRKRIAQYYHEEAHDSEMRIELSPGRYEPEFRPRSQAQDNLFSFQPAERAFFTPLELPADPVHVVADERKPRSRIFRFFLSLGLIAVIAAAGWLGWRWMHPPAIDVFWAPVLSGHPQITLCLPRAGGTKALEAQNKVVSGALVLMSPKGAEPPAHGQTLLEHESLGENVVFSDVRAAVRISDLLAVHNKNPHFLMSVATTLDDLRQGPAVLVGGLDNQWSMRALSNLQFQFAGSDQQGFWITDRKHPENKSWWLDLKVKYATLDKDYAIVARVHDATTGEPEVIVAGIGMSGTVAASELLADPQQQEELRRRIGPGFRDRDFEAVISSEVVNGMTGSPHILTVAVW